MPCTPSHARIAGLTEQHWSLLCLRLPGTQTLGEEYVDILQYDSRTRKVPTLAVSAMLQGGMRSEPALLCGVRVYQTLDGEY